MATKTEINQAEKERERKIKRRGSERKRDTQRKQRLSDQFFELGRAIRDLDWIEMGFVIDRYTFITIHHIHHYTVQCTLFSYVHSRHA